MLCFMTNLAKNVIHAFRAYIPNTWGRAFESVPASDKNHGDK